MKRKMKCPICGKRAFDISKLPSEQIEIEMKCPNCKQIITIPCTESACFSKYLKGGASYD